MNTTHYLELIHVLESMKRNTRHSWLSDGRRESVAEHSWRLMIMAYFVKDEFPQVDHNKLLLMCLFHDIGEAFTGDIPSFLKSEKDENHENHTIDAFVEELPVPYRSELQELFQEMNALQTIEARIYKALDKMEAVIQHNQSNLSTWLPIEYDLQLTYGTEETRISPYLEELRSAIRGITLEKTAGREV